LSSTIRRVAARAQQEVGELGFSVRREQRGLIEREVADDVPGIAMTSADPGSKMRGMQTTGSGAFRQALAAMIGAVHDLADAITGLASGRRPQPIHDYGKAGPG
jgi:hypothetical protein